MNFFSYYSHLFEDTLYIKNPHQLISKRIPLKRAFQWMISVFLIFTNVAQSPVQRCLFSILHMSRDLYGPISPVWIFYALESIYKCKVGENFSILFKRLSTFLDLPASSQNSIKKKLRLLYDLRSGIVHGGLDIDNPSGYLFEDSDEENSSFSKVKLVDFGFSIMLATIQKMIILEYKDLEFEEIILGT